MHNDTSHPIDTVKALQLNNWSHRTKAFQVIALYHFKMTWQQLNAIWGKTILATKIILQVDAKEFHYDFFLHRITIFHVILKWQSVILLWNFKSWQNDIRCNEITEASNHSKMPQNATSKFQLQVIAKCPHKSFHNHAASHF